jgi:outer membrane protein
MPNSRRFFAVALPLAAVGFAFPAHAQEAEDHSSLTVGIGAAYIPSYEGSDDHRVLPIAQARGKVNDFAFWTRGAGLYVDAIPDRDPRGLDFEFGPLVNVRFDRTSRKQTRDDAVAALGKLGTAIEVGGFVGIGKRGVITSDYDNLSARIAVARDVAGAHDGYVVTPAIEYTTPLSPTAFVGLGLSAEYVGKKYGRYYYDIDAAGSAASGLPVYAAAGNGSGFKRLSFNLSGSKSLSGDLRRGWALFAVGGYARLLGDYADSPVVAIAGSKDQWLGAVGIGYTF